MSDLHVLTCRLGLARRAMTSCVAIAVAAFPLLAFGEEAGANGQPAVDDSGLEEVTVTAQKRAENLQKVPISVDVVTAKGVEERGVDTTADLVSAMPGLIINNSGQAPNIFIRGVGTQNTTSGDESENSVYIDGVYQSAMPAGLFSFNNIDRVEVLKGPQGTLFGRNATGGLINVITRTPSFTPTGEVDVGYGDYNTVNGSVYVSGPLTDTIAADFAFYGKNQEDGWGKNYFNDQKAYAGSEISFRSKVLWQPNKDFTATLAADFSQENDSFTESGAVIPGALGLAAQPHVGGFYDINSNLQPSLFNQNDGVSLKLQYDLPWASVQSISAYRTTRTDIHVDQDRTQLQLVDAIVYANTNQTTQELQIQSLPDSKVNWIAGAFYLNSTDNLQPLYLPGAAFAALGGYYDQFAKTGTNSYAGYGQATVPVMTGTNLTAGIRYTLDHRDFDAYQITGLGPAPVNTVVGSKTWAQPTWHLSLDHDFSDNLMAYVSYGRGFKSGTYDSFSPSATPVNPERLDAYELGTKSEWFDHHLRLNGSAFLYNYDDIQILQAVLGGTQLLNAAAAQVKGLDLDAEIRLISNLSITVGMEFLDAHYSKFPNAPATFQSPASCTPVPGELPGPRTGGDTNCVINASGNQMIRAPDFTAPISATYRWDTSFGNISPTLSYYYNSGYPFEPDNRLRQPAYSLVNANLAWTLPDDRYQVSLWGRNLSNTHYYVNMISSVGDVYTAAAPLTFGISLKATW